MLKYEPCLKGISGAKMSKPAKKVAIFVHGWNATGAIWSRPRWNPNPIKRLFESKGYAVVPIDMPDKYIAPKKECYHYAEYLSQKVEEHALARTTSSNKCADEITLVAHSMGGVATLLYLREEIGNTEAKKKINRVITIASPNHGTDVPIKHIAHIFALLFGGISEDALLSRIGACYRQIKLASPFMQKLNTLPEHAPNVEYHCIWTRGDVAIVPNHTAIIPGANNYYIDSLRVGHLNILWSKQTLQIIKAILDGNPILSGLQTYPPTDTGAGHAHLWFPSSGKNGQLQLWSPGEKRYYLWSCRNEGCNVTAVSINRPPLAGCAIGQLDEKYRWHKWQRTGGKGISASSAKGS